MATHFQLWLKGSENATWDVLTAALDSSGNSKLADRLRAKYLTVAVADSPPASPTSITPPTAVTGGNTDKVVRKSLIKCIHVHM